MNKLLIILITAFSFISCNNNPLENTQWEVIPNTVDDELSLISFDKDTCAMYVTSSLNGKSFVIGLRYKVKGNEVIFSELNTSMSVYPKFIIDGNFLIFEKTNVPTLRKVIK